MLDRGIPFNRVALLEAPRWSRAKRARPRFGLLLIPLIAAVWLSVAAAGTTVLPGDVSISRAVQGISIPVVGDLALFANTAGETPFVVALTLLLVLGLAITGHHAAAALLLVATAIRSFNPLLKLAIESPRPTTNLVDVAEAARGFGFPSGHVMGVTLFYGAVIYLARDLTNPRLRYAIQAAALFLMFATGFGRIYSGAHWPSDVLGGYLWGGCFLFLAIAIHRDLLARRGSAVVRRRVTRD